MTRGFSFFQRQFYRPVAVLKDLESVSVDNSLTPLNWLENGRVWVWKLGKDELDESGMGMGANELTYPDGVSVWVRPVINVIGTSVSCPEALRRSGGEGRLAVREPIWSS